MIVGQPFDRDRSDPRAGKRPASVALLVVAHAQNRFDRKHRGRKGLGSPAEFGKRDRVSTKVAPNCRARGRSG